MRYGQASVGGGYLNENSRPLGAFVHIDVEQKEESLDQSVEQRSFALNVAVQRHALDSEPRPKPPHAEGLEPILVDELERGIEDQFAT
jgi:hypothetical protein